MKAYLYVLIGLACLTNVHAEGAGAVAVEILAKSGASWDGSLLPAYPTGAAEISILKIRIPPGAELPIHQHPVINAGVLLSGALTVVTANNETLHLKAGEAIVEVVGKWHYGKNEGSEPAEILVFYAGTPGLPLSIQQHQGVNGLH